MTREPGKYGLRPIPHGARWDMRFGDYIDLTALPPIPKGAFGHSKQVTQPWGIYMNDRLGDCVVAAKQHKVRLWHAEGTGADTITFSDATTQNNYGLFGNYRAGSPETDQGCDMLTAAKLELVSGVLDDAHTAHRPGIALQLQAGNWEQLMYAIYLFDGVELGILVTADMEDAFRAGRPWDEPQFNPNAAIGGHCVLAADVSYTGLPEVITWAEPQQITKELYTAPQFNMVTMAYASQEKLRNGVDEEGLSWSDMRSDIRRVAQL